jgi:hypothetical protein
VLVLLVAASSARAQMQCDGRQIEIGATIDEVLRLCGEPQQRVRSDRWITTGLVDSPASQQYRIPVEQWTYDPPGQFSRTLIFESGKLVKSQSGGYPDLPPQF